MEEFNIQGKQTSFYKYCPGKNKLIPQVHRLKYLGIILVFDRKLTFKEHINYMANKWTKLIFSLSKAAKRNWGLNYKALKTKYLGGILPPLIYGQQCG